MLHTTVPRLSTVGGALMMLLLLVHGSLSGEVTPRFESPAPPVLNQPPADSSVLRQKPEAGARSDAGTVTPGQPSLAADGQPLIHPNLKPDGVVDNANGAAAYGGPIVGPHEAPAVVPWTRASFGETADRTPPLSEQYDHAGAEAR